MFDVAVAGDMVIIPPDLGPFLVSEEQRKHLPAELVDSAVVVQSCAGLIEAIETG